MASDFVLKIIWGALTAATILYAIIAFILRPGPFSLEGALPDPSRPYELMFCFLALAVLAASMFIPKLVAAGVRRQFSNVLQPSYEDIVRWANTPMIVLFALRESIAIYGFVLVMMGSPAAKILPFAIVSFVALLFSFPSAERLKSLFPDS